MSVVSGSGGRGGRGALANSVIGLGGVRRVSWVASGSLGIDKLNA